MKRTLIGIAALIVLVWAMWTGRVHYDPLVGDKIVRSTPSASVREHRLSPPESLPSQPSSPAPLPGTSGDELNRMLEGAWSEVSFTERTAFCRAWNQADPVTHSAAVRELIVDAHLPSNVGTYRVASFFDHKCILM